MFIRFILFIMLSCVSCQSLVVTTRPSSNWAHVYAIDEAGADSFRVEIFVQDPCGQHPSKYWAHSPQLGRDEAHVLERLSDVYAPSTPVTLYDSYSDSYSREFPNREGIAVFPLSYARADSVQVRNHRLAIPGRAATRLMFIIRQASHPDECSIVEVGPHNLPLHADGTW